MYVKEVTVSESTGGIARPARQPFSFKKRMNSNISILGSKEKRRTSGSKEPVGCFVPRHCRRYQH